jgi:hypothetical protein
MSPAEVFCSERAKGVSIGATIMGGFGAVWLAMGLAAAGVPVRVAIAIVVPVFVLIACLGPRCGGGCRSSPAWKLLRRSR